MSGKRKKLRTALTVLIIIAAALAAVFFVYVNIYYRADDRALAALESDEAVEVEQTSYGWFFDGPGESAGLIFYPGAKVEETAYSASGCLARVGCLPCQDALAAGRAEQRCRGRHSQAVRL